jgi:hypothetical protein
MAAFSINLPSNILLIGIILIGLLLGIITILG